MIERSFTCSCGSWSFWTSDIIHHHAKVARHKRRQCGGILALHEREVDDE